MHRTVVIAAVAALVAAGCGDVDPLDPYTERAGAYVLHSINQSQLPATISSTAEGTIVVTTGSLTLRSDRTFTEIWTARITPAGATAVNGALTEDGTYELSGNMITFNLPARPGRGALTVQGSFNGDTLTYTFSGRTVVYLD